MKFGFVSFFPFRPHVDNAVYLSKVLTEAGHECFFLTCNKELDSCYNLETKKGSKKLECIKCKLGGIHSYKEVSNIEYLNSKTVKDSSRKEQSYFREMIKSSIGTIYHVQSDSELNDEEYIDVSNKLADSAKIVYNRTIDWVASNNIDGVICFNGRMDILNAVISACKDEKIPFITTESTWFGNGLSLMPNSNCLSLEPWNLLNDEFKDKPLTHEQAIHASSIIYKRLFKKSHLEWRQYNIDTIKMEAWEVSGQKVVILPSSRSEFIGSKEYEGNWANDCTKGFEEIINYLNIPYKNCILKAHPIWNETVFGIKGKKEEKYYRDWCAEKEIFFIDSSSRIDSFDLMSKADMVLINGSSAAIEGGILGKVVICSTSMIYQNAGFTIHVTNKDDLFKLDKIQTNKSEVIRSTLRFLYTSNRRVAQFVDSVRGLKVTKNKYYEGADAQIIIDTIMSGKLVPYDTYYAESSEFENEIINSIINGSWDSISNYDLADLSGKKELLIEKYWFYKVLDVLRNFLPRGDN